APHAHYGGADDRGASGTIGFSALRQTAGKNSPPFFSVFLTFDPEVCTIVWLQLNLYEVSDVKIFTFT
ncbi:MAG: hypothetical protein RRY54_05530, partial [Angelakisella sp.]